LIEKLVSKYIGVLCLREEFLIFSPDFDTEKEKGEGLDSEGENMR
jgi:hypothetical protein